MKPVASQSSRLIAEAEIGAERLIGLVRIIVSVGLAVMLALSTRDMDLQTTPVLQRQWLLAGISLVIYFAVGVASWRATQRGWYRPWMGWVTASADCAFVLSGLLLSLDNTGLSGSFLLLLPAAWLAPVVLAFGALRFDPRLQTAVVIVLLAGLLMLLQLAGRDHPGPAAMALLRSEPSNAMRVVMVALGGLVLVIAALRARSLLERSIAEAQQRVNLTRYLPAQLAPRLAQGGLEELRRGRRHDAAVLFTDMRGFTRHMQQMPADALSPFISRFRRIISRAAAGTGGIIDKFMGDAALVVFESDGPPEQVARAAIACAERLQQDIAQWSAEREAAGEAPVEIGIGLHWGELFSGVIGDEDRLEYSVFGDTVNIAARLEELTKTMGCGTIASRRLVRCAGALGAWELLPQTDIRGREGSLAVMRPAPAA